LLHCQSNLQHAYACTHTTHRHQQAGTANRGSDKRLLLPLPLLLLLLRHLRFEALAAHFPLAWLLVHIWLESWAEQGSCKC
jgi:hypothetical protein